MKKRIIVGFLLVIMVFLVISGCCDEEEKEDCKETCLGCRDHKCTTTYCVAGEQCKDKKCVCGAFTDCPPCQGCFGDACRIPEGGEITEGGWEGYCTSTERGDGFDEGSEETCASYSAGETGGSQSVCVGQGCTWCSY